MTVVAQKFVRKPLYVDAVQVTEENFEEIARWSYGTITSDNDDGTGKKFIHIRVHQPQSTRQQKAYVGDWVLYTDRGYKIYTEKAFQSNFDKVEPESERNDEVVVATPSEP
jgi:hypothetical protein